MAEGYLTTKEVAERLRWQPKTLLNRVSQGIVRGGVHYLKPRGIGLRWKWSAVEAWLESGPRQPEKDGIRMTGGYILGNGLTGEADGEYRP